MNFTGSAYEGLSKEVCGDWDMMITDSSFPVVLWELPWEGGRGGLTTGYVYDRARPDQPAFLNLKVVETRGVCEVVLGVTTEEGYVRSVDLVAAVTGDSDGTPHGPAVTGLSFQDHLSKYGTTDIVPCLHCPTWPPCAAEFLTRPRSHGWPSQTAIDCLQQAGCHVVAVGHPTSKYKHIEWRWSFSTAEKELIHNMDSGVVGDLFVLKAIQKKAWKSEFTNDSNDVDSPTSFCSYFIKTACMSVEKSMDLSEANIMDIVKKILGWLIVKYEKRNLPHFFIPRQNLIGHLPLPLCKKVHTQLVHIRSDLQRIVLASLILDGHLPGLLREVCDKLSIGPVATGCDYIQMMSALRSHAQAKAVLQMAATQLGSESWKYNLWNRYRMGVLSTADYDVIYEVAEKQMKQGPSAFPESVLLPIIGKLDSVVKARYSDMFKHTFYRFLGDIYYAMMSSVDNSFPQRKDYRTKAIYYYTQGREMVHPDGWSDKGLVGYVLLAKLYYLEKEWTQLDATLKLLEPLLDAARESEETVVGLSCLLFKPDYALAVRPWRKDPVFEREVLASWDDVVLGLHPMSLGYYFLARYALRQGERERADPSMSGVWVEKVWSVNMVKSTKALICAAEMVYQWR